MICLLSNVMIFSNVFAETESKVFKGFPLMEGYIVFKDPFQFAVESLPVEINWILIKKNQKKVLAYYKAQLKNHEVEEQKNTWLLQQEKSYLYLSVVDSSGVPESLKRHGKGTWLQIWSSGSF